MKSLEEILYFLGQTRLLQKIPHWTFEEKQALFSQLMSLDFLSLQEQADAFKKKKIAIQQGSCTPLKNCEEPDRNDVALGKKGLREKKITVLILAGGEGSRLGLQGSKGMVQIGQHSLFEILYRKIKEHQEKMGQTLFSYVLTSPKNHQKTKEFFQDHAFWGVPSDSVVFLQQPMLPFLDEQGQYCIEDHQKILLGPDGNGSIFSLLQTAGMYDQWGKEGIEHLVVINVDNPLSDPFDPELIGFHIRHGGEISLRAVAHRAQQGALVLEDHHLKILEYYDLLPEEHYCWANSGIYIFSVDFCRTLSKQKMPLHFVPKKVRKDQREIEVYKSERFIFDGWGYAQHIFPLKSDREKWFLPVKDDKTLEEACRVLGLTY
ncbi:MAG: UTP--glucose-1-phosphate uridylyltransferase [Parachlamydiales bacterium]|nr:UTP--glucose-1-phosphate uridylyltransferase [Parachlamydiales bacterium]